MGMRQWELKPAAIRERSHGPGALIWGVGPVFTIPSATDPILGTGRVLLGPTAVALVTPGHWVIGVLVNNQWSVGGKSTARQRE